MVSALVKILVKSRPQLRTRLRIARLGILPEKFVDRNVKMAIVMGVFLLLGTFMFTDKFRGRQLLLQNTLISILVAVLGVFVAYKFFMNTVEVYIRRQQRTLNRDVLFVGRYMLIKLQSGVPFYQALTDASKGGFGLASKYVREIVDDIELGTPIEKALSDAADLSPSKEFRQILWQINTALRSGVDVTATLKSILREIASHQIIEVERYGKKLSSISLMYMLIAIIAPSLGVTLFVSFSGFLGIRLSFFHLMLIVLFMAFIQFMFLSLFRSIRPNLNL